MITLLLIVAICGAFIFALLFSETLAERKVVNAKRFDLIDRAQQAGETSVYLTDLKNAKTILQIETAISNYLDWKYDNK